MAVNVVRILPFPEEGVQISQFPILGTLAIETKPDWALPETYHPMHQEY